MRNYSTTAAAALALSGLWSLQALAAEPPYLDDRSDAGAVVRSLYNAVSRKEYARAWDYFGESKPATDFAAFVKGYEGTDRVEVETGAVSSEGAAGSVFYNIPVAIRAVDANGSEKLFAGCYTARQVNATAQEPPFKPILLEEGSLKPAEGELAAAVPQQCGDVAPAPETDAVFDQAKKMFADDYRARCDDNLEGDEAALSYTISYRNQTDAEDAEPNKARLFRFLCSMGAYNQTHIYYLWKEMDGLSLQQFATPELDIRYENDDSQGKLETISTIGYRADDELVNSSYDERTMSIQSNSKWRGVGDASSSGLWIFRNGAFTLVKYDVDASYDGEINPETVLDFDSGP